MRTICPSCEAINENELGMPDTFWFKGDPYLWHTIVIVCFYCGNTYIWGENLSRKWTGMPAPPIHVFK